MSFDAAYVLAILVLAFGLFASGRLRPDLIAMLVLVSLVLGQAIEPAQAFAGFSSFAVVTIAGLMVIGDGLEKTGVVKGVAKRLEKVIRRSHARLLLLNTAIPGVLSGFVNIVAAASFFIPVVLRLCKQMDVAQSKVLLPMACAALIGANLTLIGASHNLVVDSLLDRATGSGFGFFEFTLVGAVLLVAALAYIFLVGRHLLPGHREAPDPLDVPVTANLAKTYALADHLFEVWVADGEQSAIHAIDDLGLADFDLTLIAVVRGGEELVVPAPLMQLEDGDMLLLQGGEEDVKKFADSQEFLTFVGEPKGQEAFPLSTAELAEAVVPPRSSAVGQKVRDLGLNERYGMTAIAYFRDGQPHRQLVADTELEEGDGLLVYGPRERMRAFQPEKDLLIYFKPGEPDVDAKMKKKAPLAALILLAVIATAAAGLMPIAATAVAGAVAMILVGAVPGHRVYQAIDWRTLVLIGGMYPLGVALNGSGAADLIGAALIDGLGGLGPLAVLGGVAVLTMILTQPIHNAAVAIIMTPVAINAANAMGASPAGFCVGVIIAASAAFMMPVGHPAPMLVQEPGGYKPSDYLKFGAGLCVITLAVILVMVPLFWAV